MEFWVLIWHGERLGQGEGVSKKDSLKKEKIPK